MAIAVGVEPPALGFRACHRSGSVAATVHCVAGARHIASAPAAIALVAPVPPDERRKLLDQYDLGQATMAMMIEATALGIGTGHSAVGEQEKARAILGVPDDHIVAYLLGLGYPADRPLTPIRKPDRRPFDEVVHRGHW